MNSITRSIMIVFVSTAAAMLTFACQSGGAPRVSYSIGVGYGGYYGSGPWYRYPGRPIYIGGGSRPELPNFPDSPVATPLPDFGMPEPAIGAMDLGGFDF